MSLDKYQKIILDIMKSDDFFVDRAKQKRIVNYLKWRKIENGNESKTNRYIS